MGGNPGRRQPAGGTGWAGALHDAARTHDRAGRELHRRTPRTGPGAGELRLGAVSLGLLARAGRDEHAALVALAVALAGLVEAVADLRALQARAEQAAAYQAAEPLRALTASSPSAAAVDVVTTRTSTMTWTRASEPGSSLIVQVLLRGLSALPSAAGQTG